jgi:hypothetical protein
VTPALVKSIPDQASDGSCWRNVDVRNATLRP